MLFDVDVDEGAVAHAAPERLVKQAAEAEQRVVIEEWMVECERHCCVGSYSRATDGLLMGPCRTCRPKDRIVTE